MNERAKTGLDVMRGRSPITAAAAALGLVALFIASCGETKRQPPAVQGASGQAGQGTDMPEDEQPEVPDEPVEHPSLACGASTCKAVELGGSALSPCCVERSKGTCGVELPSLGCQPLTQPGALDGACPASPPIDAGPLPIKALPGCCRDDGRCGFFISDLGGILPFAPGCIDSTLLVSGQKPVLCGTARGGVGGAPSVENGQGGDGLSSGGAPSSALAGATGGGALPL